MLCACWGVKSNIFSSFFFLHENMKLFLISNKGHKLCDFPFTFLRRSPLLKGRKFFPYRKDPFFRLIVLGFNNTSTLVGHFVSSPREREKRDRRDSTGDEREKQGRKSNRNESEETEEIKTFSLYPYLLQG